MNTDRLFFSIHDIMELFGVSQSTARRWINAGRLDARRFGRVVRITAESVRQLADSKININTNKEE